MGTTPAPACISPMKPLQAVASPKVVVSMPACDLFTCPRKTCMHILSHLFTYVIGIISKGALNESA
jgi:hypothetical protein